MAALRLVDLPAFGDAYGHDLAENPRAPGVSCAFSAFSAYRPLIEARRAGYDGVRIGLCEGAEGLRLDGDRVVGVSDRLLQSVDVLQEAARLHGLYLAWTLLDARGVEWADDTVTARILRDPEATAAFARAAAAPILRHLDRGVCAGVTLVREPLSAGIDAATAGRGADLLLAEVPEGWDRPLSVSVPMSALCELHAASTALACVEITGPAAPDAVTVRAALPEALHEAPRCFTAVEAQGPERLADADAAGFFAVVF